MNQNKLSKHILAGSEYISSNFVVKTKYVIEIEIIDNENNKY
jgi:hypothetical protein